MALGAIPVQSASSCANDLFENRGVVVDVNRVAEVEKAIEAALRLASSSTAGKENREKLAKLFAPEKLKAHALSAYDLKY